LDRGEDRENYAYPFIHTDNIKARITQMFGGVMQFDVIIGNPPYQLSDGGFGRSATPIYHKFVEQAMQLNPYYLIMVIPSRWFAGGKGLANFRAEMLSNVRIRKIVDFEDASEVFPRVDVAGGICYFLWDWNHQGPCEITNVHQQEKSVSIRALNEFPTLIRHNQAVSIIRKILSKKESRMSEQVTSRKPFGLPTNARPMSKGDIILRWQNGEGLYKREAIKVGIEIVDKWKVITSKVSYDHAGQPDRNGMRRVLSIVEILPPGYICTETYIVVGAYNSRIEAERLASYLRTRFARFLISQLSFSQDITKDRFMYVPILDMNTDWTDEKLYRRYGLTEEETAFIEAKIHPMESNSRSKSE